MLKLAERADEAAMKVRHPTTPYYCAGDLSSSPSSFCSENALLLDEQLPSWSWVSVDSGLVWVLHP
jgi:hypothetical protein